MFPSSSGRLIVVALVLCLLLPLVGCKGSKPAVGGGSAKAVLSGTVKLDGKVVNYGIVTFHPSEGRPVKTIIHTDGTYSLPKFSEGEFKVVVQTGPAPRGVAGGGGGPTPNIVTIELPAKYTDQTTTDLVYKVSADTNEYNIEMKSAKGKE